MAARSFILSLGIVLLLACVSAAEVVFQRLPDSPDARVAQASWDDLLTSPLGDEIPFMLGGVCRWIAGTMPGWSKHERANHLPCWL